MSPSVLSSKQIRLNIFGYKAFLKNHFLVNFIVRLIKKSSGSILMPLTFHKAHLNRYTRKIDLVSTVWRLAPFKVCISLKLSMI